MQRIHVMIVLVAAVGIAAYRKFYVPPLDQIDGLTILETRSRGHEILTCFLCIGEDLSGLGARRLNVHAVCASSARVESPVLPSKVRAIAWGIVVKTFS